MIGRPELPLADLSILMHFCIDSPEVPHVQPPEFGSKRVGDLIQLKDPSKEVASEKQVKEVRLNDLLTGATWARVSHSLFRPDMVRRRRLLSHDRRDQHESRLQVVSHILIAIFPWS